MGTHLIDGEFQSDKYPSTPRGKVPLSVRDATAQDLLWEYAQRRRSVDAEFADDLETALQKAGYRPHIADLILRNGTQCPYCGKLATYLPEEVRGDVTGAVRCMKCGLDWCQINGRWFEGRKAVEAK